MILTAICQQNYLCFIKAYEARYAAKAAPYAHNYRPPPDDVQLLFFSVETSGFIHRTAKDFLKRILASSNSPPTLPCAARPLPQVLPPSSPARLLVPRFYALNPTPARPLPDIAQ